jgi:hypothetical protein
VEVDEARRIENLATQSNIETLLTSFKKGIKGDGENAVSSALDDHVPTMELRNNTVIEYDCAMQLLQEAKRTQSSCADNFNYLG